MKTSEKTDLLWPALFTARTKFVKAAKDKQNTHLKNKYATLDSMIDAVRPALEANGIMIIQSMLDSSQERAFHLETTLMHQSGQFASFFMMMPVAKVDPQGYGSAMTYARRYALAAALGISQADDDAQQAVMSAEDWKKVFSKINELERLKESFQKAWASCDAATRAIVHEYYEARKIELSNIGGNGGFRPAKPQAVAEKPKPEGAKPDENAPGNIESFDKF